MKEFERLIPQLDKSKVTVSAFVGERYLNLIEEGFSEALIYSSRINLEFLGSNPQIFKPGMPFKVYVSILHIGIFDNFSFSLNWLSNARKRFFFFFFSVV